VAITHATGIRYTYPQPQHLCCGHAAWSKFNRRPWSKFDRRQQVERAEAAPCGLTGARRLF